MLSLFQRNLPIAQENDGMALATMCIWYESRVRGGHNSCLVLVIVESRDDGCGGEL